MPFLHAEAGDFSGEQKKNPFKDDRLTETFL